MDDARRTRRFEFLECESATFAFHREALPHEKRAETLRSFLRPPGGSLMPGPQAELAADKAKVELSHSKNSAPAACGYVKS